MRDQSIRGFLQSLEQQGELIRFTKEVDPLTTMAAVEWKAYNQLGKSSLFTNIKGYPGWQACSQILADRKKWSVALGVDEDKLLDFVGNRVRSPLAPVVHGNGGAPVKEVKLIGADADLGKLPAMVVSERDPAPFIASGMAIVKDPETGIRNMSVHRQHITGKHTTGFAFVPRHALRIYRKYCERNQPMPVAVVVGAHPAIFFASAFTTSFGFDELSVAGALLEDPIRMVKCETIDIDVPADAELVIEGEIFPDELADEGPFGEITGNYAAGGQAQVFRVKAITHRKNPVFYAIHCGMPVTDTQATTALGIETQVKEHLRNVEGGLDLLDVRSISETGTFMLVIKLRPNVEGQAKTALMAALSSPYIHPKIAIAVDDDVDAADLRQVMWSIATRAHPSRDIIMIPHTRVHALDNVSDVVPGLNSFHRTGTKMMIDATKPSLALPAQRARFEAAMPKGFATVDLADFLP